MYVMHNHSFLLTSVYIKVLQDVGIADHFPSFLEVCSHATDMYKSLLGKRPLHFNTSLLLQSLMAQNLVIFHNKWILKELKNGISLY